MQIYDNIALLFSLEIVIDSNKEKKSGRKDEADEITPCWVYCIWTAIFIIIILVLAALFLFSKHQHAKNGGVGSGMSLGGGGMGGGGMCFDASMKVWAKNETQQNKEAKLIMAKDVEEGDLVSTIDLSNQNLAYDDFTWTRATDVDIFWGKWKAYRFIFANTHTITVTSPHIMILWLKGNWYSVPANQVQIGDQMRVGKEITHVTEVLPYIINAKVAIETEDGTIIVNNVLTSGLCDHNPKSSSMSLKANNLLNEYKLLHFGEFGKDQCMDTVAWKNTYLKNNGQNVYHEMLQRYDKSNLLWSN